MKPFEVRVDEAVLDDLRRRLDATRWPDEAPDASPEHGFGLERARELAAYWRDGYDWRAAEAVLNGFEQSVSDGGVHHFAAGDGPPLVLLHGWPSSVWEFTRIAPLLAGHARVIVPSLPGYTFSFTPGGKRASIVDCADGIHGLMTELGHERYLVAGGDWGASTAARMAHAYPDAVQALHLYMMPLRRPKSWPESEGASREELKRWMSEEGGYIQIQGTRPQTLAYGLHDSPVGLMSWIAREVRALDRRARRPRRRPVDHGDDLLGHGLHRLLVLALLGAQARRLGARRGASRPAGGIAAPLTYLDFPKELVHVPRVGRGARVRHRALGGAGLRRALPGAGGHRRARRQPAALRQPIRGSSARARRAGSRACTVSPTFVPSSALPTGESIESLPSPGVGLAAPRRACRSASCRTSRPRPRRGCRSRPRRSGSRPRGPRRRAAARAGAGSSSPGAPDRSWRRGTRSSP